MYFKCLDSREFITYKPMCQCAVMPNRHKGSNQRRYISLIGRVSKYYACDRHSTVEYMTEIIYYRPCDDVTKNSVHDRHPIFEY